MNNLSFFARLALYFFTSTICSRKDGIKIACFSDDFIGRNVLFFNFYEHDELNWINDKILIPMNFSEKFSILDIGANIGNHTIYFAKRCKSIISFEPHPLVFKILDINVIVNSLHNVERRNVALGERSGHARFHFNQTGNIGGSRIVGNAEISLANTVVEVIRGDDFLQTKNLEHPIGLIKIDVEGHELSVLRGLSGLLKKQKPIVLFEANSMHERESVVSFLRHQGYDCFGFLGNRRKYSSLRAFRWLQRIWTSRQMNLYMLQPQDIGPWPMCIACSAEVAQRLNLRLQ